MKRSDRQRLSALTAFAKGELKVRKKRAKETVPRDQAEARFRNEEVIPFLKKDKRVKHYVRVENGIGRKHGRGLPDFIVWTWDKEIWLELKASGSLSDYQEIIKSHHERCKGAWVTARTLGEIEESING